MGESKSNASTAVVRSSRDPVSSGPTGVPSTGPDGTVNYCLYNASKEPIPSSTLDSSGMGYSNFENLFIDVFRKYAGFKLSILELASNEALITRDFNMLKLIQTATIDLAELFALKEKSKDKKKFDGKKQTEEENKGKVKGNRASVDRVKRDSLTNAAEDEDPEGSAGSSYTFTLLREVAHIPKCVSREDVLVQGAHLIADIRFTALVFH